MRRRVHAEAFVPWAAILLVDYGVRRGRYDVDALHTWGRGPYWYRHGVNWPALAIYAVGVVVSFAVAKSTLWTSPLTHLFGGADVSLFAGLMVTGFLYFVVARRQRAASDTDPLQT